MADLAGFALQEFLKLISRKIWMIELSWNFHTVDGPIECAWLKKGKNTKKWGKSKKLIFSQIFTWNQFEWVLISRTIRLMKSLWKFHNFSITQILREINFLDSRSAKSATITNFEATNCDFFIFFIYCKLKFTKVVLFRAP